MKKIIFSIFQVLALIYLTLCSFLYFFQEQMIFHPDKLNKDYKFEFEQTFEELNIKTEDGTMLNGLLFKADSSKGLIFYLHGNAGSLESWGGVAKTYTDLAYDVFIPDYRGYGKSEGEIKSQEQLYSDMQTAYNLFKTKYEESKIIVLGYSIGTGPAAHLAASNQPRMLILQAPYFSLTDMMKERYSFVPTFLLKYKFPVNEYIPQCKMPIVIFHGDQDEVIPYNSSVKLKQLFKPEDKLITLPGQGHNGMSYDPVYLSELKVLL